MSDDQQETPSDDRDSSNGEQQEVQAPPSDRPRNHDDEVTEAAQGSTPLDRESGEAPPAELHLGHRFVDVLRRWFAGEAPPARAHLLVGLGLPSLIALFNLWRMRHFTIDDAYISYRYADKFAEGLGLVYNAGERIEGYTNFSWTVILGLGIKFGLDPDLVAKSLGSIFALASLTLCYHLSSSIRPLKLLPCVATWLLATSMPFIGYAVFGLETPFFIFLVLMGTLLFSREEKAEGWTFPWSGIVFGLAGLTRPEAPMYLGLLMLFLGGRGLIPAEKVFGPQAKDDEARPFAVLSALLLLVTVMLVRLKVPTLATPFNVLSYLLLALGAVALLSQIPRALFGKVNLLRGTLFVAPIALHVLWRKSYYGSFLPNTFTAKTGDIRQQLAGGLDYVSQFLRHDGVVLYLLLFGLAYALVRKQRLALAMAATVGLGTAYVILVGGDWMPLFRFMAPVLPFAFMLIDVGARSIVDEKSRFANYGLLMLGMIVAGQRTAGFEKDRSRVFKKEKHFWDMAAGGTAKWFKNQEKKRGRADVIGTIALGDIGEVGYKTGYPILDLLGLVDPVVAKLPGGYTRKIGSGFRDHFFKSAPRYFILISANRRCDNPSVPGSQSLFRDRRFLRRYVVSGHVPLDQGFRWCVYENRSFRPDAPAHQSKPARSKAYDIAPVHLQRAR